MVILFNCWKLWGDAVRLPDEVIVTLTLNVGDPVVLELMDVDDDPVKLCDTAGVTLEVGLGL